MKILALIFTLLIPINFVGMVACKDWKKDEKYWLFAMIMSFMGFWLVLFRMT